MTATLAEETSAVLDNRKRFKFVGWLGILGLVILFGLLRWNNFNAPLTRDEGEYAYAAQLLTHGRLPYADCFLQKPPMVAYSYALAALLAPHHLWFPRLLAGGFAALATVLLGYCARREFGPGAAWPAMWLMTPMILLPGINQFIANTEMFMLLPLLGTIAVYVHGRQAQGGFFHWLAVGALAAITVGYKYTVLPMLVFVLAAWVWEEWRGGKSWRVIAGHGLAALAGGIFGTAGVVAPFLVHDGGRRLWECTIVFNRFYVASSGFGLDGLWMELGDLGRHWWILFLVPGLLIFKREWRAGFWLALFFLAWLASAGSYYGHYYICIMPFWALLSAVALRNSAVWVAGKISQSPVVTGAVLTGVVVVVVCLPDVRWMCCSREQFWSEKLGAFGTFLEAPLVGARVAELTAPGDYVYVAGSEPQILCYAHRFSSTRFDIAYPFTLATPLAEGYQAEVIHDLQRRPPGAIVLAQTRSSWLIQPDSPRGFPAFLDKLLAGEYQVVGGYRFDGKQGRWQEPLMDLTDQAQCSLILFKRKAPLVVP
jgi:hypothetical protein